MRRPGDDFSDEFINGPFEAVKTTLVSIIAALTRITTVKLDPEATWL